MPLKSRIKYIQSLGDKKFRDTESRFVAEGPKVLEELLGSPLVEPVEIYALPTWTVANAGKLRSHPGIWVESISEKELERISFLKTPQQVLGIFKKPPPQQNIPDTLSLVLDGIQDPGNLGTIFRIADWFAVPAIFCSPDCADIYGPKAVQASMGSLCRVGSAYQDLEIFLEKNASVPRLAAALQGENVFEVPAPRQGLLIIGSEGKGIRPALLNEKTRRITIPKKGGAESLNAAVATGILLAQLTR